MPARITAFLTPLLIGLAASAGASDIGDLLTEFYPPDLPGGAVIVVKDGERLFEGASGMSNVELGVPLQTNSVFRLASVTKQFTAAAIMLLRDDGNLSLADPVTKFLPDYPTQGYHITIEHLLTHTSGIANITAIPAFSEEGLFQIDATTMETVDIFKDVPMDFAPGEQYRYSNSGYILLGAIIETITGLAWHEFISERIFEPLGMTHSFNDDKRIIENRASGYLLTDDGIVNSPHISMSRPHAAGALRSTVGDLAIWSNALFDGELLSQDAVTRMTASFELNSGEKTGYGYGLVVSDLFGRPTISHTGGIPGFLAITVWLPEERLFVAVLSNTTGQGPIPDDVAYRMAFAALGETHPFDAEYAFDNTTTNDFVGVFRIDEDNTLTVTETDGSLFAQPSGDDAYLILPFGDNAFYYPGYQEYLVFRRDNDGQVVAVDVHYGPTEESTEARKTTESTR